MSNLKTLKESDPFPKRFTDRYASIVDDPGSFFTILMEFLPKTFRVNTLKSDANSVMKAFGDYGLPVIQVPWYKDAFTSTSLDCGSTLEHFVGSIYFQELVSMIPPLLVQNELEHARLVVDACAAPGSKTTQLAALMHNRRTIIANDLDYNRIKALKFNLEKSGVLNTVITNRDFRFFPDLQADIVILDSPCSAEGTIRKNFDVLSSWSEKEISKYSRIQKNLIIKAFDILVPGGVVVYSTCTFAPEENEEVLNHLIQNRPDAKLEPFADLFDGFRFSDPLTHWDGVEFDPAVKNAARVWPHHNNTGGFFLAKVRK